MVDIALNDGNRVPMPAEGGWVIHQYKDYVVENSISLLWDGQSNVAPSSSSVVLQIFNHTSGLWETIDEESESAADVDFQLTANVPNLTNYKIGGVISCRVYQRPVMG